MKYPTYIFLLASVFLCYSSDAFSHTQALRHRQARNNGIARFMSDDMPSDTSDYPMEDDNVVTVQSQAVDSESGSLVSNVLDLIPTTIGDVSESSRAQINEILYKLEALNPTSAPARSSLLNGQWELKYSGGYVSEGALDSPTRQIALFLYSGGYR